MAPRLRPYQEQAIENIEREWKDVQSTLLLMATGLGKTLVASEVIRRHLPERTLFLCHREELVNQACETIHDVTGIWPDVEMAGSKARMFNESRVVVGTVQTLCRENRLSRFAPSEFDFLVTDEVHHAPAQTWRRVIDYFKQNQDLRMVGLTATADRFDETTLAGVIDTCAFEYGIKQGIDDGYLVPVKQML